MNDETKDFLLNKGYYVKVCHIDTNLYLAQFPQTNRRKKEEYQYYLLKDEWIISRMSDKANKSIQVEDYEIRPIFVSDILIKTYARNLELDLVLGFNKEGLQSKVYDMLPTPVNIELESYFFEFIKDYLTGVRDYNIIAQHDLQTSFDKFISIYDSGGIL